MTIKKAFVPVVEFLEANKDKKVASILEEVKKLTSAKAGGGGRSSDNVIKNAAGEVTHIFCYYHKRWEDISVAEYGVKASSPTGKSNMCKEGTSAWTKQQAAATKAKNQLLEDVGEGKVDPKDLKPRMEEIEVARQAITPRADKHGTTKKPALG